MNAGTKMLPTTTLLYDNPLAQPSLVMAVEDAVIHPGLVDHPVWSVRLPDYDLTVLDELQEPMKDALWFWEAVLLRRFGKRGERCLWDMAERLREKNHRLSVVLTDLFEDSKYVMLPLQRAAGDYPLTLGQRRAIQDLLDLVRKVRSFDPETRAHFGLVVLLPRTVAQQAVIQNWGQFDSNCRLEKAL